MASIFSSRMAIILLIVTCFSAVDSRRSDLSVHIRTRRRYLADMTALNIGSVEPKQNAVMMEIARTWYVYADDHPDGEVMNLGRTNITAYMVYGTVDRWVDENPLSSMVLQPGQRHRFTAHGNFAATAIRVYNHDDKLRAIFYATRGGSTVGTVKWPTETPVVEFDKSVKSILFNFVQGKIMDTAFNVGAGVGLAAEILYELFFPEEEEDPWTAVKDKVIELIEHNTLVVINAIIDSDMKPIQAKIQNIVSLAKQNNPLTNRVIMALVHETVGFETKFYFTAKGLKNENINLHILPLFTKTVNLKLGFYTFVIAYADTLNMTKPEVNLVTAYRLNMIKNAIHHIVKVKRNKLDYDYNTMDTADFYNVIMKTRLQVAVHGEDYISYWMYAIDPENNPKVNDTIVAYSDFFGRSSPNLYAQALTKFGSEPLTPPILDISPNEKRRTALKVISFQYHGGFRHNAICGIILRFEDREYMLGAGGPRGEELRLNGHRIDSMQVLGNPDIIDCLRFNTTDGRTKDFGHNCNNIRKTYKVPGHYIASLYTDRDRGGLGGRIMNIAVSYQLNHSINGTDFEIDLNKNSTSTN